MRHSDKIVRITLAATMSVGIWIALGGSARAHCDTMSGPVIADARIALEKGDVTPVLKWVKPEAEAEVRAAFGKAETVRGKSPDAKELADQYFVETLVRVHRMGEGAPYTGIKTGEPEPMMAIADKALADGSADAMIDTMTGEMKTALKEKFQKALDSRKHKDESVEMGRQFVSDYVTYVHYVEGIHMAIMAAGEHHGAAMGERHGMMGDHPMGGMHRHGAGDCPCEKGDCPYADCDCPRQDAGKAPAAPAHEEDKE